MPKKVKIKKKQSKLHPADRKALNFFTNKEGQDETNAFKKAAVLLPTWKTGESVKKRDKRLFTPPR